MRYKLSPTLSTVVISVLSLACIWLLWRSNTVGDSNTLLKQNLAAVSDSLRVQRIGNNVLSKKYSYQVKRIGELRSLNAELSNKLSSVESVLDSYDSYSVSAIDIVYNRDSATIDDIQVIDTDSVYTVILTDSSEYRYLVTEVLVDVKGSGCTLGDVKGRIIKDSLLVSGVVGVGRNREGLYEGFSVFREGDVSVKVIESVVRESRKNKRRLSVGVYCGVGAYYDPFANRSGVGVIGGVGVGYRIW